ncbi:MAG: hypothetical protein Faunusvirus1_48 [Faunusvirus sp.]|uniref:Uncharacterized protein n=1 Tax=Faunusvirus sp. TaxID=2487766 RepID=A0A3G4ZVU9_9VIRU|nr:MAG: hypothetical protein Faunusvirus1_48 [Faunusvirus sp.]
MTQELETKTGTPTEWDKPNKIGDTTFVSFENYPNLTVNKALNYPPNVMRFFANVIMHCTGGACVLSLRQTRGADCGAYIKFNAHAMLILRQFRYDGKSPELFCRCHTDETMCGECACCKRVDSWIL